MAGVIIDKRTSLMQLTDTASITFCALNKTTNQGWQTGRTVENLYQSGWETYCSEVEDTLACIDEETFNLNDTIKAEENDYSLGHTYGLHFINTNST